jgi:hypothetical protein
MSSSGLRVSGLNCRLRLDINRRKVAVSIWLEWKLEINMRFFSRVCFVLPCIYIYIQISMRHMNYFDKRIILLYSILLN